MFYTLFYESHDLSFEKVTLLQFHFTHLEWSLLSFFFLLVHGLTYRSLWPMDTHTEQSRAVSYSEQAENWPLPLFLSLLSCLSHQPLAGPHCCPESPPTILGPQLLVTARDGIYQVVENQLGNQQFNEPPCFWPPALFERDKLSGKKEEQTEV